MNIFEQKITITWSIEDVCTAKPYLSKEQASSLLYLVKFLLGQKYQEVIFDDAAQILFPKIEEIIKLEGETSYF